MKTFKILSILSLTWLCLGFFTTATAQKQEVEFEKVKEKCKGQPFEERVRVTVARFNVTTTNAQRKFGDEMATMLSNALAGVNCFRVLNSVKKNSDSMDEINMGQQGYTNDYSSPQGGQMLGAQVVLTGEVTEFHEGETRAGLVGITAGKNSATIGFILQVVNPQTREILWSQSIEAKGKKPGSFSGLKLGPINLAGGSKENRAIQDVLERGIIKGVVALAEDMDNIPFPAANSGVAETKSWNSSNCPVLSAGSPKVMVLMQERHVSHYYPRPNSESAIISKFVNAGFQVIDASMYAATRKDGRFEQALKNPTAAASLGSDFGADVVIMGQGTSQVSQRKGSDILCRATLSVKAIRVNNSQIIGMQDAEAGAQDITETAASTKALKNAGKRLADKLLEQFCTRGMGEGMAGGGSPMGTIKVLVVNTDFMKMRKLSGALAGKGQIKKVENKGFSDGEGTIAVRHEGSSDEALDIILANLESFGEITGFDASSKEVTIKMN